MSFRGARWSAFEVRAVALDAAVSLMGGVGEFLGTKTKTAGRLRKKLAWWLHMHGPSTGTFATMEAGLSGCPETFGGREAKTHLLFWSVRVLRPAELEWNMLEVDPHRGRSAEQRFEPVNCRARESRS